MDVLESPGQTVLYWSSFDEAILIAMNNFKYELLEPLCEQFSDNLEAEVEQSNWSEIRNCLRWPNYGYECDKFLINARKIKSALVELIA